MSRKRTSSGRARTANDWWTLGAAISLSRAPLRIGFRPDGGAARAERTRGLDLRLPDRHGGRAGRRVAAGSRNRRRALLRRLARAPPAAQPSGHARAAVGRRAGTARGRLRAPSAPPRPRAADGVPQGRGARAARAAAPDREADGGRRPALVLRRRCGPRPARVRPGGQPRARPPAARRGGTAVSVDGQRPTRDVGLYTDGSNAIRPEVERVERGSEITGERTVRVDACVIGADALGWSGDFIYRNVRGCVGSGICTFGCPTSAKQHVGITYVPLAWNAGATTFTGCRARRVVTTGGRVRSVEALTAGGGRLRVDCDLVVVACGAIGTPLFLRAQDLRLDSNELGRNLSIHPATGVRAEFDEDINMAEGVPQSYFIDEFADEGIMFEGAAGPPDYAAASFPFWGERHRELMLSYPSISQFGLMVSDLSRGHVHERGGLLQIRYDLNRQDTATFKRGIELLCELYWAAGAKVVYPPIEGIAELRDGDLSAVRE